MSDMHSQKDIVCRTKSAWCSVGMAVVVGFGCGIETASAQVGGLAKTYLVPMPENEVHAALKEIHGGVGDELNARTQIVPSLTNTVIHYDHWEDGYEDNLATPTQATTQIWGDGVTTNGTAPGFTNDRVRAGGVIELTDEIQIPRPSATNFYYDGADMLVATLPVSVSRVLNAKDPGEALAGGVNIYPLDKFGTQFIAPVGTNSAAGSMFQYAAMFIMASADGTIIQVDADNDDVFEETQLLNKGETYVEEYVAAGATVKSSKPVQGHLITGAISATYQMRWFELIASFLWSDEYLTPVGTMGGRTAKVWLYNPNSTTITTHYETVSSSGTVTVAADDFATYVMPADTGARFYTVDGSPFRAVEAMDPGSGSYDWGHSLFPANLLTELALIGWGPGSGDDNKNNGSPIWVIPASDVELYVDYDGDPSTGPNTDSQGNKYDFTTNLTALGSYRIFDNADNDQTGMRLYTLDGTKISTVWGLDPDSSSAGTPYLDMGYAMFPVPVVVPAKQASLYIDADLSTTISPGDSLMYTILVARVGFDDLSNDVYVVDSGPDYASYVTNTLTLNGTNQADDVSPPASTAFPLDEGGFNVGRVRLGDTHIITYVAKINSPFPTNESGVLNSVEVDGQEALLFVPVDLGSLISGQIRVDADADGDLSDPDGGLSGVTMELFTDPNGDGDPADGSAIATNVSGVTGNYFFDHISTGSYVIVETDSIGYVSTGDSDGTNDNRIAVTLAPGVDAGGNDFLDAQSGIGITKTGGPAGIWFPELETTFTISIVNTGSIDHSSVTIDDPLLSGMSYVTNSTWVLATVRATNSVRDEFGSVSYANNDGTEHWAGDWQETDEGGSGPAAGAILVTGGELRLSDAVSGTPSIYREAELTDYASAELSFEFDTTGSVDPTDEVEVQVSTDAASWTTLDTFAGAVSGWTNYDITPYMAASTYVRFEIAAEYNNDGEYFYVDDLTIRSTELDTVGTTGGPPPTLVQDYELIAGGSIEITFNATLGFDATTVTNTASVTSSLHTNPLYATFTKAVDTNALPDRIGGQVCNDLDGDADPGDGDRGIPGVQVVVYSDPNGDGNPSDGVGLQTNSTDSEGFFLFGNLVADDYVLVETDLAGFESTGDSVAPNDNWVPVTLPGGVDSLTNKFFDWTISGLEIAKAASQVDEFDLGQEASYTIVITNTRVAAQGSVAVTDVLPPELTYISSSTVVVIDKPLVTDTFRDEFNSVAYTNSDGSHAWLDDWEEIGDHGGASVGDVVITSDLGNNRLRVRDDDMIIWRSANLSRCDTAELSFLYRRDSLEAGEYVAIEVATNAADVWTELERFEGPATDGAYIFTNYDISAYVGTNTGIRFRSPDGGMANGDQALFDNVQIECVAGGTNTVWGDAPPTLIENYVVEPGESITITFDVRVDGGEEVINVATVTTAADTNGLSSAATNEVAAIAATQGVSRVVTTNAAQGVHVAWTAATDGGEVSRSYDVLCVDSPSWHPGFHPALSNQWNLAATVVDSHYVDTGGVARASPQSMGRSMRFYRAAREDRWLTGQERRFASREIYVAKCVELEEGENWVSLFMVPDSNSVAHILGTNALPAGAQMSASTRVEWYGPTANGAATNIIWLSDAGVWLYSGGGVADQMPLPLHEGFNIVTPPGSGQQQWVSVGRVPLSVSAQQGHSVSIVPGGMYNVVSYNLPYRVRLADSGLREAGFTGAPAGQLVNPNNSDELRILARGDGSLGAPKARILMDQANEFVFWRGGSGSAEDYRLSADDALIVYTRRSTNPINWNLTLPYPAPTKTMSP